MKTMKLFLSIVGFAVTGLCCGPLFSQNNSEVLFYSAYYNTSDNRLEHRINQLPPTNLGGDQYNAPVLSRTYFVPIGYDLALEPWMTSPFENSYTEEVLEIESWMTAPFENTYIEEVIDIEMWMTRPFESIITEAEQYSEEDLPVEEWMTKPFI